MNKNLGRSLISYVVLFMLIFGVFYLLQGNNQNVDTSYTETDFSQELKDGNVASVYVQQNAEVPTGTVEITTKDGTPIRFYVSDVNEFQELYNNLMKDSDLNVTFEMSDVVRPSIIEKMLPYVLGLVAMIVFIMLFAGMQNANSGGGSMMNFGKSRAKMTSDSDNKITFNEVAGLKEEKEDLEEIVDFLKNPNKYIELGARIPKGILLVGPP